MPDPATYELCLNENRADFQAELLMDAINAASDQNRTTWLTDTAGKRIARIAPVDEIPDEYLFDRENPHLAGLRARLQADGRIQQQVSSLEELSARLAGKRQETEPVWKGHDRDLLLQTIARQVEEIHRTLGLERDEDGDLTSDTPLLAEVMAGQVDAMYHDLGLCGAHDDEDDGYEDDDDPLGPPWYGKRGEIAARLESGDLTLISRDLLLQVLTDTGLVSGITSTNHFEEVWDTIASGRTRPDPGPKMTPGRPITMEMLSGVLSLAGMYPGQAELATWTYSQRVDAYDWAIREHLNKTDGTTRRVPRPSFIPVRRTR